MDHLDYSYKIHTFGCKVNTYDTGLLQKRLTTAGLHATQNNPKVHVLNTCAVTAEATKEAIRWIRKLKASDPFCRVIVTGCAAQVDTEQFEKLAAADAVVANSHKGQLEDVIKKLFAGGLEKKVLKSNIFKKDDLESDGGLEDEHTRSFLKIQDGCNSFCTFCVIPFARGKSRSIPIETIIGKVNELGSKGIGEVVLTGVHIGDYNDKGRGLECLIEGLLLKTRMPRIRLSSLEPIEVSDRLLEAYSDERLCPHFHMSIQSANTKVLSQMKRKYTAKDVERALKDIERRLPNPFVGMDVIAGFPGETDDEFNDTLSRLSGLPWTKLHVFPYSPRPGTLAMKIDGHHHRSLIKERAKRLNSLSRERYQVEASKQIGTIKKVLGLKSYEKETSRSISRDYWSVALQEPLPLGVEATVKVIGCVGFEQGHGNPHLTGQVLAM